MGDVLTVGFRAHHAAHGFVAHQLAPRETSNFLLGLKSGDGPFRW